jgi:hypothetical protein
MVVLVVYCEPLSVPNYLFIREFAGNFVVSETEIKKVASIWGLIPLGCKKIPYST